MIYTWYDVLNIVFLQCYFLWPVTWIYQLCFRIVTYYFEVLLTNHALCSFKSVIVSTIPCWELNVKSWKLSSNLPCYWFCVSTKERTEESSTTIKRYRNRISCKWKSAKIHLGGGLHHPNTITIKRQVWKKVLDKPRSQKTQSLRKRDVINGKIHGKHQMIEKINVPKVITNCCNE